MAMDDNGGVLTIISDLVDTVTGQEKLADRKSNTIVAAIGGVITMLLAGGSYLVESEMTLPSWFPLAMTLLGILGTVLKISKTKNGVTPSVADKLQKELTNWIDITHLHELESNQKTAEQPTQIFGTAQATHLREYAESILRDHLPRQ